ncbi:MAG: hypothetical protein IPK10_14395 [Bacteroidetes bacterium]|nr:hypothetical protein [Bacteroidota bacterium]
MKTTLIKQLQPHLIAIGIFLLISFVYFSPALSGKALKQGDIAQWTGMQKEIADYRASHSDEPLWTGSMFSGMPAYQISVLYPSNLVQYVNKLMWLWMPNPINLLFLAMLGFYLLMISFKADFRIAIAGALLMLFVLYFVSIRAGHNTKVHAIALIPLIFAGVLMAYRGNGY